MLILKVVVLEDDLENRALCRDDFVNGADFGADIIPVSAEDFANIDDHIDLVAARLSGLLGLSTLMRVVLLPWGKPMTGQTRTSEPSSTSRARAIEYGLMHAVAVSKCRASSQPFANIGVRHRRMQE